MFSLTTEHINAIICHHIRRQVKSSTKTGISLFRIELMVPHQISKSNFVLFNCLIIRIYLYRMTPRYRHDRTCSKLVLSSTKSAEFPSSFNLFMHKVLLVLTDNRLVLNHRATSLTDCCSYALASVNDFPILYTALSSPKILFGTVFFISYDKYCHLII